MLKTVLLKIEKFVFRLLLAGIFPLFLFLFSWWLAYFFGLEHLIPLISMAGLVLGIIIDVVILKSWINQYLSMIFSVFTAVYIFYSFAVFGFFMGVPIFNLLPAVIGGYYYGRKLSSQSAKESRIIKERKTVSLFTSVVMFFICSLSSTFALLDKHTGNNLKGMFNLNFDVTKELIIGIIVIGGLLLIITNYFLTYLLISAASKIKE